MSTQRFTPEFKEEAVRQVIERGYPVSEVATRVGVSTHSLYKWVKAVAPDKQHVQKLRGQYEPRSTCVSYRLYSSSGRFKGAWRLPVTAGNSLPSFPSFSAARHRSHV